MRRNRGYNNPQPSTDSTLLRDLDIELELLKRKRDIIQQEQEILNRFESKRQYDYGQSSKSYNRGEPNNYQFSTNDYSNRYDGPSRSGNFTTPHGPKRQIPNQYRAPANTNKNFTKKQKDNTEKDDDDDDVIIVEPVCEQFSKMKHYKDFMDQLIEARLPKILPKFKDLLNENSVVAMDVPTGRCENRRVLIDRLVDVVLGLPHIHAHSDIRTLFLTPLISAQCTLNELDPPMKDKDGDYVFVSLAVRKLEGELRTLFERKYGSISTLPTLENLINFLEEHVRCVETEWSSPPPSKVSRHSPQTIQNHRWSPPPPGVSPRQPNHHQFRPIVSIRSRPDYHTPQPAQLKPVHSAQQSAPVGLIANNMPCPFCKQRGHKLIACPRYNDQTIQGRWDFIKARNRCRRCLGPHYENECKSTRACKDCGSKGHHTSLHRPDAPSPTH